MKVSLTYQKHEPTTISGHSITVMQTFFGTEEEIKKVEDACKEQIGTMIVFEDEEGGTNETD